MAMGTEDAKCDFKPMEMYRRPLGDYDVLIDMKYCGVCHTDIVYANGRANMVMKPKYPAVPGHELAGVVEQVGSKVTKFKVGDQIGVGTMIDSCLTCKHCKCGDEQKCKKVVATYAGEDWSGRAAPHPATREVPGKPGKTEKGPLIGGYSTKCVIFERFGIKIPSSFPLEAAGPVMCAGITMYTPLKDHGAGPGVSVGVVGLGGLGIMGIKLAKEMGCKVTAISRSKAKEAIAKQAGATSYVATAESSDLAKAAKSLDIILDTVPCDHDLTPYKKMLRDSQSRHVVLGLCPQLTGAFLAGSVLGQRSTVTFSFTGGIKNTEELIALCDKAEPKIVPQLKIMPVQELNNIFEILEKSNDEAISYVLDLSTLNGETASKCTSPPPKMNDAEKPISLGSSMRNCCSILCGQCSPCCCCHCMTCGVFSSKKSRSKVSASEEWVGELLGKVKVCWLGLLGQLHLMPRRITKSISRFPVKQCNRAFGLR